MTKIEKARETLIRDADLDLLSALTGTQQERCAARFARGIAENVEALIDEKLIEHAERIRAIAREEIDAASKVWIEPTTKLEGGDPHSGSGQASTREDKSPPAVEAPAAGDTTALARRLATALMFLVERCEYRPSGPEYAAMLSTQGGKERKALSGANAVLAEARKAGLIE